MTSPASEPLCLDQFLKLQGATSTGGGAKLLIQSGDVKLNGKIETRRRKKLQVGDIVEVGGEKFVVTDTPRPAEFYE